jgi:hypothetical protein
VATTLPLLVVKNSGKLPNAFKNWEVILAAGHPLFLPDEASFFKRKRHSIQWSLLRLDPRSRLFGIERKLLVPFDFKLNRWIGPDLASFSSF